MIKFENITKIYSPNTTALDDVSFEVASEEFVSIVGKSGAGKTTLLKMLLAEERPNSGKIFFDNQDIYQIKDSELSMLRRKIGVVFQDYKLFPLKNVYENISYIMEALGASDQEIKRDVPEVLEIVGLSDRYGSFPHQLSGGEKQRAAFARALVHRPLAILADEPTGNLDPYHTQDIIQLLERINEMGTTIILATHDKGIINSLKKRVITLEKGKVVRDEKQGRFIL
jgi:cell division transport system ATP-binding protein